MDLKILRDTKDYVVVDKPSGLLTMKGRGELEDENNLADILESEYGRIFPVHRLDKDVSGVILFAKNAEAHKYFSSLFETRNLEKIYLALVHGRIMKPMTIDKPIKQRGSGRMSVAFDGKPSVTKFRVIKNLKQMSLLEVSIVTGRRHQIRVHLYSEGHPVVGDNLYGDLVIQRKYPRLMLHSWRMKFQDMAGKNVYVEAEPPKDFKNTLGMF